MSLRKPIAGSYRSRPIVQTLEHRRLLAAAPVPIGVEFPLDESGAPGQSRPSIAASGAGHFVAAWDSTGRDGSGRGVYARRIGPPDEPPGPDFRVNTHTASDQMRPAVAAAAGGFVVVWQSDGQDGTQWGVFGQRYDADGNPLGAEFQVNSSSAGSQADPAVAMAPDGRFVVAWGDGAADGDSWGIAARLFDADGAPRGDAFIVNVIRTASQSAPAVGVADDGRFVVCWQSSEAAPDTYGVYARRFAADGTPQGDVLAVSDDTTAGLRDPAVAVEPDGDFVVAWHTLAGDDVAGDGSGFGVFARRFAADGAAGGEAFQVNTHSDGDQALPALSAAADGSFLVAWHSTGQDGDGLGVYARRYGPDGAAPSVEVLVNTQTAGDQSAAAAAADPDGRFPDGRFLIAWQSVDPDGSDGVFAQHFAAEAPPEPPAISVAGVTVSEADAGATTDAVFHITLSAARSYPVSVRYATQDGSAVAPDDYAAASGTLTFAPGETSREVTVAVAGDALDEAEETFSLLLSEPVDATLAMASAVATIADNDPLPFVMIVDTAIAEGDEGENREAVFDVTLSAPSGREIRVVYRLGLNPGDTATRDLDYAATPGILIFAPGETAKTIVVPVVGDSIDEGDETFSVLLGFADPERTFAFPDDGEAVGTIFDDDAPLPVVTGVFVNGTAWRPAFREHLAAAGAGSEQFGFLVGDGADQLDELPWTNLNQVSVRFNRAVTAGQFDLGVRGIDGADYPPTLVEYDADQFTWTWTFARSFPSERLTLRLQGSGPAGVRDAGNGVHLDGDWSDGADAYPSGDGSAGGDLLFGINVLPGDVTRDGRVDAADLGDARARQSTSTTRPGRAPASYTVFSDVNGSGRIDVLDYMHVRSRQQTTLPAPPEATVAGAPFVSPARRIAPIRRQVFGTAPILA